MNNNVNSSYIGNINLWIGFLYDYIGVASKCEIFMKQYKGYRDMPLPMMIKEVESILSSVNEISINQKTSELFEIEKKLNVSFPQSFKDFYCANGLEVLNLFITYRIIPPLVSLENIDYCSKLHSQIINIFQQDIINNSVSVIIENSLSFGSYNYLSYFPTYYFVSLLPLQLKENYQQMILIGTSEVMENTTFMLPYLRTKDNECAILLDVTGAEFKFYLSFAEYIIVELIAELMEFDEDVKLEDLEKFSGGRILDLDEISRRKIIT